MLKYWLFRTEQYYPSGGMSDFVDAFLSLPEIPESDTSDYHAVEVDDNHPLILYRWFPGTTNIVGHWQLEKDYLSGQKD